MNTHQNAKLVEKYGGYEIVAQVLKEAAQGNVENATMRDLAKAVKIHDSKPRQDRPEICGAISYQMMEALVCRQPKDHPAGACIPEW